MRTTIRILPVASPRTSHLTRVAAGLSLTVTALLLAMVPLLAPPALAAANVVSSIGVGLDPLGVAVNPTTNRVYVANGNSNTVSVIDGATNTLVATVPVQSAPETLAVNPSTNRIYAGGR